MPIEKAKFLKFLAEEGFKYKVPQAGNPKYLMSESHPFPTNPAYVSQEVLSNACREEIYRRVFIDQEPIKVVSAKLGVDHRRVAAVVRMKQVEKQWEMEVCSFFFVLLSAHRPFL